MKAAFLTLFLAILPGGLRADCVTADDLASGISFKRQDGRSGLVQARDGAVEVDYATKPKTAWTDFHKTAMGIYDLSRVWVPTDDYIVGGGPGGSFRYKYSGKPPVPKAGTAWKTRVSVEISTDDGTEFGAKTRRAAMDASYNFLAESTAKLSGCTYRIQPVEARFTARDTDYAMRWIYFPDLGFGLETRTTNYKTGQEVKLGLTALTPKG